MVNDYIGQARRLNWLFAVPSAELYQGMWDCKANSDDELPFKRGQIVRVISKVSKV